MQIVTIEVNSTLTFLCIISFPAPELFIVAGTQRHFDHIDELCGVVIVHIGLREAKDRFEGLQCQDVGGLKLLRRGIGPGQRSAPQPGSRVGDV